MKKRQIKGAEHNEKMKIENTEPPTSPGISAETRQIDNIDSCQF